MTTTKTAPTSIGLLDPWPAPVPSSHRPQPSPLEASPECWPKVPPGARPVFGAAALRVLADHPGAGRAQLNMLADRLWHSSRSETYTDPSGGPATIDAALSSVAFNGDPITPCYGVMEKLLWLRAEVPALRAHVTALGATLARLEAMAVGGGG